MIFIKNSESKLDMASDGYSTIEGAIRQSLGNPRDYRLTLLMDRKEVVGKELVKHGDILYVRTEGDDIPIYAFKMNKELERVLKDGYNIWNG